MHSQSIYSEGQTSEIERRTKTPRPTVRRTDPDLRWRFETKMRRDSDLGTQTVDGTRSEEQIASRYLYENRNTGDGPIRQTSVLSQLFMINN